MTDYVSQKGITKEQSTQLQGLAVLLMIYHHFFNDLTIYGDALRFWKPDWIITFAWFGKICVGIFAFVSGYGMQRVLERRKEPGAFSCLRQVMRLLVRYWIVFLPFMGLFFVMGKRSFEPREFVENFFCLRSTYNGAFWYVQEYVIFMALALLLAGWLRLDKKHRYLCAGIFGAVGVAVLLLGTGSLAGAMEGLKAALDLIRIAFVLVFFAGWLTARFRIFEKAFSLLPEGKICVRKLTGIGVTMAVAAGRNVLSDSAAYAKLDFLLVPVFVAGVLLCLEGVKPLQGLLYAMGRMSAWLWLTHLFIFDLTKDRILSFTDSHLVFFVIELFFCILAALVFWGGEQGIDRIRKMKKAERK